MGGLGVSGLRVMSNLKGSRMLGVEGASMSSRNRESSFTVLPSEDPSGEVGYRSLAPSCQSRAQAVAGAPWVGREAAISHHRGFLPRESSGLAVERGGASTVGPYGWARWERK